MTLRTKIIIYDEDQTLLQEFINEEAIKKLKTRIAKHQTLDPWDRYEDCNVIALGEDEDRRIYFIRLK